MKQRHPQIVAASIVLAALLVAQLSVAAPPGKKSREWYMKTRLHVVNPVSGAEWVDNGSGIFGKLEASMDGHDLHDHRAFASTVASPAALVFIRGEEWGEFAGEYLSDYRKAKGKDDGVWQFTVFTNQPRADVTLTWEGLFELTPYDDGGLTRYREAQKLDSRTLGDLSLVDLETLDVVPAVDAASGKLNSYSFSMSSDSSSRQFLWVLGSVDTNALPSMQSVERYIGTQREIIAVRGDAPTSAGKPPIGNPLTVRPTNAVKNRRTEK